VPLIAPGSVATQDLSSVFMTREPNLATGIEFQELLQSYHIKAVIMTTAYTQTNGILKCTHQVIANELQSLHLMSFKLNSLADIQQP
jgi:hypothetical protein